MSKGRKAQKQEENKKSKKLYILMLIGLVAGIFLAIDPALLPPKMRNHPVTQKVASFRGQMNQKIDNTLNRFTSNHKTTATPDPKKKETGYKSQDRQELDQLMQGGTPK